MANQGQGEVPNHLAQQHAADVPGHHLQQHTVLLDAARTLMLLGAVAAVSAVGNPSADADAANVFLLVGGFVAWLPGAWLLWFVPLAGRFPGAAALAGAVIASATAALAHLFVPLN
ncbi:hypothetical protein BS78_10G226300 [Paspalum vaginatum]|nr:hypothetical protein BS78_10G226300 [Paspalum vaginatum]